MKNAIKVWGISFGVLLLAAMWASPALAYPNFSGCAGCHSIFGTGPGDSEHDTHAGLSNNDCNSCHAGGTGFSNPPLPNCVRCHGRNADAGGDSESAGIGRGLRQHHVTKGAAACDACHMDTNHNAVGSAPESVLPSFYPSALGGAGLDPCDGSEERFASNSVSLDNDGDGLTDGADPDCAVNQTTLVSAVLPSGRSVQVGNTATAFATIINAGSGTATSCAISPVTVIPATFSFQTTDPATNQVIGTPNTPVDIAAGALQSFVFALTATAPVAPTDVQLSFDCSNTAPAAINSGLNTLFYSASSAPVPDIVALAATLSGDGIVNIPGTTGTGVFAVATVNVGAGGSITASADTGSAMLPVNIFLCQTDPVTSQCISAIGPTVTTQINAGETPTFGIFVTGTGDVPFDPTVNRIFVRFEDAGAVTRGSTSVAVRTQP